MAAQVKRQSNRFVSDVSWWAIPLGAVRTIGWTRSFFIAPGRGIGEQGGHESVDVELDRPLGPFGEMFSLPRDPDNSYNRVESALRARLIGEAIHSRLPT
jgi:hypothetical protein